MNTDKPRDTDSFGRPLPSVARRISELMPPKHQYVILYIADPDVAIHGFAVVGWNSGSDEEPRWWTGVPAHYIGLGGERWTVTHWAPLPGDAA